LVTDPYQAFRQAVDRPEDKIDLGRAALTIALPDYPNLDVAGCLARVDDLAVEVTQRCGAEADVYRSLAALNHVLFTEHGFCGNREDYFDPKNSFLNEVLERKTGIPISLSVLYMEVAQRIGLVLAGVGFPGHFLVKYACEDEEIVIDPFLGGEVRSHGDLRRMLRDLYGGKVGFNREFLEPVSKKQILKRMLANLKAIYLKKNDPVKTLLVLDRLIILDPAAAEEIRDRGLLYLSLECFTQAREDFQAYLKLAPNAEDAVAIREQVVRLGNQATMLH
jgi:regulator of sirC expression with transglutaminase-like and TPR domain